MTRAVALIALVALGCGGTTKAYHATALVLPKSSAGAAPDFAACKGGVALVPVRGGIMAAGFKRWLVPPSGDPIESVACDEAGDLFVLRGGAVVKYGATNNGIGVASALPEGTWHLIGTVDPFVWVVGTPAAGGGAIYRVGESRVAVYEGSEPVHTAAAIGTVGIVAVVGSELVAWRGPEPEDLGAVGEHVDGLAVGMNGELYISGKGGIAKLVSLTAEPERVARGIHGPLRLRDDRLFVLWREHDAVMRLEPTTIADDEPHHFLMFREGPAEDRVSSLDIAPEYITEAQATPLTFHSIAVPTLILKDPLNLTGGGVLLGATFRRRFVAQLQVAYMTGSAPVQSVMFSGSGSAVMTSDVGEVRIGGRIGVRIPFGYFALRLGTGIIALLTGATAYQETATFTESTSGSGAYIPAWARFDIEPWCNVGVFAGGSYDYGLGTSSATSIEVGLELRFARRCY